MGAIHGRDFKGQKAKQPYAIAMKDGAPFGIAGIWENWKDPASGEWLKLLQSGASEYAPPHSSAGFGGCS
jgi:hypothetical protein